MDPARVVAQLRYLADSRVSVVGARVASGPHDEVVARAVLRCLGEVAAGAVPELRPVGLYACGGEVAAAVISALGAQGFAIEAEVLPLAVAGYVVGGPYDGLPFATKGGLVGKDDAASLCLQYLLRRNGSVEHEKIEGKLAT